MGIQHIIKPKAMKLKCENCGEIIESGIVNVSNHQFECKSMYEEKIPDCDWATAIIHPIIKLTPLNEEQNVQGSDTTMLNQGTKSQVQKP